MATTQPSGTAILRKLTIRECVGTKAAILAIAQTGKANPEAVTGKKIPILRVLGQVQAIQPDEGDNGPYVKLRGQFQGTNLQTGEVFENAPVALLPNMIADLLAAAFVGGKGESVNFAVEIDVAYDETAATMYTYSARSLLKAQTAAPVIGILAQLATEGIALTQPLKIAPPELSAADRKKQEAHEAKANKEREDKAKEKAATK